MSTPEASGSCSFKNKYSPFSGGISKSLLTPCRRVGLSRKRKTPVNNLLKSVSEESPGNNTNSTIKSCSESETTPVIRTKFMERKRSLNPLSISYISNIGSQTEGADGNKDLLDNCEINSSKKHLFQTFTSAELFDSENSSFENDTVIEDSKIENNTVQILNDYITNIKSDAKQDSSNYNCDRKLKKKRLSNDTINFEYTKNKSISQTTTNNFCKDFVNGKINEKEQIYHTISEVDNPMKHSTKENSCMKNCKIQIQRLSEDEIKSNKFPEKTLSVKTLSKRCSSNISDDADFFTSTPEEEKTKRKSLETKVKILERQIKEKQLVLENLHRASIYKSKHNIQDLKQLTSIWLEGCVQALKDLLTHLKAHGPIDLTTVLTNMRIPKEIVAKLPL